MTDGRRGLVVMAYGTPASAEDIEAYYTVDLNGNYRIGDHWTVGATVANVTDNEHWEAWGGDLIGRRALAHVAFAW